MHDWLRIGYVIGLTVAFLGIVNWAYGGELVLVATNWLPPLAKLIGG